MYRLLRSLSVRHLLVEQTPALGLSILIAELFYKFHSFTLECLAFLATWALVDIIIQGVAQRFQIRVVEEPGSIKHTTGL